MKSHHAGIGLQETGGPGALGRRGGVRDRDPRDRRSGPIPPASAPNAIRIRRGAPEEASAAWPADSKTAQEKRVDPAAAVSPTRSGSSAWRAPGPTSSTGIGASTSTSGTLYLPDGNDREGPHLAALRCLDIGEKGDPLESAC